jgi:hypothetical protein
MKMDREKRKKKLKKRTDKTLGLQKEEEKQVKTNVGKRYRYTFMTEMDKKEFLSR